jgi:hypothetical protein
MRLTKAALAELKARVFSRLRAELAVELANIVAGRTASDAEFAAWLATQPPTPPEVLALYELEIAKSRAMTPKATDADLEPLRKLYPEIAECIARPRQPTRGARRDYARNKPFEMVVRRVWLDVMRRMDGLVADETDKRRGNGPLVVAWTAEFLGCSDSEIKELKRHPPPLVRQPPPPVPSPHHVQLIREYLEKAGKVLGDEQFVTFAAGVMQCEPDAIRKIIARKKVR